jgi:hypothetical protein
VAETHTLRDGIIIATVGTLLGSLFLEPVRSFLGGIWRFMIVVAGVMWRRLTGSVPVWVALGAAAAWGGLTGSVPIPVWVVLAVAAIIALLGRLVSSVQLVATIHREPAPAPVAPKPAAPPALNGLEDAVIRQLAHEDGSPLQITELATRTEVTMLRVEQAIEGLEDHGLVRRIRSYMGGTAYGLTTSGRDFAITRGYV